MNEKLACCQSSKDIHGIKGYGQNIFALYENQDPSGKLCIIELFTPFSINPLTKKLYPLQISNALTTITTYSSYHNKSVKTFSHHSIERIPNNKTRIFLDRKISFNQTIKILKKNGIETSEEYAKEILDFLYLLAKMLPDRSSKTTSVDDTPEGDIEHSIII